MRICCDEMLSVVPLFLKHELKSVDKLCGDGLVLLCDNTVAPNTTGIDNTWENKHLQR